MPGGADGTVGHFTLTNNANGDSNSSESDCLHNMTEVSDYTIPAIIPSNTDAPLPYSRGPQSLVPSSYSDLYAKGPSHNPQPQYLI